MSGEDPRGVPLDQVVDEFKQAHGFSDEAWEIFRESVGASSEEIHGLRAELAASEARAERYRAALASLLESHDNLYVAHFGGMMPPGFETDPTVDIAAKPARQLLAASDGPAAEHRPEAGEGADA
jgi:hypothetical protein